MEIGDIIERHDLPPTVLLPNLHVIDVVPDTLVSMSSEKKRKAASQESNRPPKKQQLSGSVKVNHVKGSDSMKPVVGELSCKKTRCNAY